MRINPAKCVFGARKVKFLGYLVSEEGTQPFPEKIKAIREFPQPATIKQLRQFSGTINFYRRFVPEAAEDQAALHDVLKSPKKKESPKIEWTAELSRAFQNYKESLSKATLLIHPDPRAELALTTDASDRAVQTVIQQRSQKDWQPLAFFSKKLNTAQTTYSPYDRDC